METRIVISTFVLIQQFLEKNFLSKILGLLEKLSVLISYFYSFCVKSK